MRLRLWVDDKRNPPDDPNWIVLRDVNMAIDWIRNPPHGIVWEVVSLDHDMGHPKPEDNGNKVLTAIQELVVTDDGYTCPRIRIHTDNGSVRRPMQIVADRTMQLAKQQNRLIQMRQVGVSETALLNALPAEQRAKQQFCFIIDATTADDLNYGSFFMDDDVIVHLDGVHTWQDIAVQCGFFDSKGQAKKNGWEGEIPSGWNERSFGPPTRRKFVFLVRC
jgi:hypothetical protein